jgi:hypothetical protein
MLRPTHYMWIDSDQVFNFQMLEKLIKQDLVKILSQYNLLKEINLNKIPFVSGKYQLINKGS